MFIDILIISMSILIIFPIYSLIRNNKVFESRMYILNLDSKRFQKNINDGGTFIDHNIFLKLPSYYKMLYSFKPLKPEYWLNDEDLKLLGLTKL